MDNAMKECETEANTLCSQPSHLTQNTRYYSQQQDSSERKKNGTCFVCHQQGHWYRDCPFKSSNNNNSQQHSKNMWCRCGHGRCEVKTSKSEKNPGRMYYSCPIKRGARCNNGFVKWCNETVVESDLQPPQFKYPECVCNAGVCRRERATQNKYYFACPIKENQGSCGYKVWEDELLHNESPVQQSLSCKRFLNDAQDDNDLDEGGYLLVNCSKQMKIMDNSEAELSQSEDKALEKASQLSCLSESTPSTSRIIARQHVFPRHIFAGAGADPDPSFGSSPLGWLGRLLFSSPQNFQSPSHQSIFCCVFPSLNPTIDVPKQLSITDDVPCAEQNQLTQLSNAYNTEFSRDVLSQNKSPITERKPMSSAQRQRQVAFVAQQQLLIDLVTTLEPHEHESMKEAAEGAFALLDNMGANDPQFSEHVWDFINLTSSVSQMTKSIENSVSPEEHSKCLEEENARIAHIHSLYAKTEAMFQAANRRRESLLKEISHFEAMLSEKRNQLKCCETDSSNIGIELSDLKRTMLEADTALKARTEEAEFARKFREERQAKQIAAKSALEKAFLGLEY